jgi:serine/threonine protein kinase/alpha-tubulin suppressor-like RCC1 family protein
MTRDDRRELPRIPELDRDYEFVRELGRGGTAVVYLARDRELGRDVAVKLIRPSHLRDEDAVARLVREARTVGRLQHPNIVMLLGTRRLGDSGLALILQFVPGRTLKRRIREDGPLPFDDAERILRDLGRALAYAHRRRIVHRDIKPENVYLDDDAGIARLADFGIARAWDSDSGLTLPGTAIGTPTYMSPEQVDGGDLDGRSDLYALGLLGWEMLSGRQPWAGESLYSVIYKQKHEDLPDLASLRPDTPQNLRRAIAGALPKDRDERWATADDFLQALARGSRLPPEAPTIGGIPAVPDREWEADATPDARTIRFRRPGETLPNAPPTPPPGEPHPPGPASPEEWEPYPEEEWTPVPVPGRTERRAERLRKRKRLARAATLLVLVLLVGGGGAAVAYTSPDGQMRSLLGQILPLNGDDGLIDDEPYGTWRPPDGEVEGTEDGGILPNAGDPGGEEEGDRPPLPSATRLGVVAGGGQEAPAGRPLPGPVVVRVEGGDGEPLAGVPVLLSVVGGGGSVSPSRAVTGADGTVSAAWTLGAPEVAQALAVALEEDRDAITIVEARSVPRVPAALRVESSGLEAEAGQRLPEPIAVRALDGDGSGIPGVPVRFEVLRGGGQVAPGSVQTDGDGMARAEWILGEEQGVQQVSAVVEGEEEVAATLSAEATPPRLPGRSQVVAGGTHSCLLEGGALACWGDNTRGQLGAGEGARRAAPGPGVPGGPFTRVSTGLAHGCALDAVGRAYCWGANESGQLGDGSTTPRSSPVPVTGAPLFVEIEAGMSHTCARSAEGRVYCWGANGDGQLGNGTTTSRANPTPIDSQLAFRGLAVGWRHTCALDTQGTVHCWGTNTAGELGRSTLDRFPSPARVAGGHTFVQLSAGNAHTCGLTSDGRVACWGANDHGQIGDGSTEARRVPATVRSDQPFTAVSAGAVHTCAISSSGAAFCWGRNIYGQVGDGSTSDRNAPVEVSGAHRFDRLHAFGSHTCGRTPAGDALCWGYNAEGQLGDGTLQNRSEPVRVGAGGG